MGNWLWFTAMKGTASPAQLWLTSAPTPPSTERRAAQWTSQTLDGALTSQTCMCQLWHLKAHICRQLGFNLGHFMSSNGQLTHRGSDGNHQTYWERGSNPDKPNLSGILTKFTEIKCTFIWIFVHLTQKKNLMMLLKSPTSSNYGDVGHMITAGHLFHDFTLFSVLTLKQNGYWSSAPPAGRERHFPCFLPGQVHLVPPLK